jgi:ATP-binding protein involved in chromosome partitioning
MRIALPLSGGQFSQHFGHSSAFWVCDVQAGSQVIPDGQEITLPDGGGCGAIPAVLAEAGVNLVIAGGMGAGAVRNLARYGIDVITGASGDTPEQIVQAYLSGALVSTGQLCQHHEGHGEHGHEHGNCHRHGREA